MKAIEIGKKLLEGPVEPMSRWATEIFTILTVARTAGTPVTFNGDEIPQSTQIIKSRCDAANVKAEDDAILFLSAVISTPGQAVLMCAVLKVLEEKHGRPANIFDLADDFPMGFPTEASLHDAWIAQKGKAGEGVDNWLDRKEAWNIIN